jgi:hypothetical protein
MLLLTAPKRPSGCALQYELFEWVSRIPCRGAVLAGLAEQKPQLLQARTESIFRRHNYIFRGVGRMTIGVGVRRNHNRCPCSSSSQPAPCRIQFSLTANRSCPQRNPDLQLWRPVSRTAAAHSSHDNPRRHHHHSIHRLSRAR